jgi:hypothetical protein
MRSAGPFRQPRWVVVGLLLYSLVLAVSPALHHDFACHLKDPSHCTACQATPIAPQAEKAFDVGPLRIAALPCAEKRLEALILTLVRLPSIGRAPPA